MQVTLSTGKTFEIAPLTISQFKELAEFSVALGPVRTVQDDIDLMTARLKACHQAMQNAGVQKPMDELEMELSIPEVDELFDAVTNLTSKPIALPAFARKRCNGHNNRN